MYVTDTHNYVWYLENNKKPTDKAKKVFEMCDRGETTVVIPTIVLLEMMYIAEEQKAYFNFQNVMSLLNNSINYFTYPLDMNAISKCEELSILKDLHDRVIVAVSKILNAKLITKDEKIRESNLVETIW